MISSFDYFKGEMSIVIIIYLCILESYEKLWGLDRDGRWTNSELQD